MSYQQQRRQSEIEPDLLRHVLTKNMVSVPSQTLRAEDQLFTEKCIEHSEETFRIPQSRLCVNLFESLGKESVLEPTISEQFAASGVVRSSSMTSYPFHVAVIPPTPDIYYESLQFNNDLNASDDVFNGNSYSRSFRKASSTSFVCIDDFLQSKGKLTRCGSCTITPEAKRQKVRKISKNFPASFSPNRSSSILSPNINVIRRSDIAFGEIIGKGGFGKVYAGTWHGQSVAIKVVQKRRGSGVHREILQAERLAYTLKLRHENIVNILGLNLCDGLRGDALIVMELISPLTLQSFLDDATRDLSQPQRLAFSLQITKALAYLHCNHVAHLDVKPRNVLMTWDDTCKLGDFGSLLRTCTDIPREETEYTQLLGTLPYRAPELMKGCFPSNKADVYSLGITLWQLATRETPHSGANPHWLIYQVTKVNRRPEHHDTGSDLLEVKYRDLYTECWDPEPDLRPHAADVIITLIDLIDNCWDGRWREHLRAE